MPNNLLPHVNLPIAERATVTPFRSRFFVALSLLLYAMFLGCARTAMLGAVVGHKPGSGAATFGSDLTIIVSQETHDIVRASCLVALIVMG